LTKDSATGSTSFLIKSLEESLASLRFKKRGECKFNSVLMDYYCGVVDYIFRTYWTRNEAEQLRLNASFQIIHQKPFRSLLSFMFLLIRLVIDKGGKRKNIYGTQDGSLLLLCFLLISC